VIAVSDPNILVQLSDLHLRVGSGDGPSTRAAEAAVAAVGRLRPSADAIVVTGDLVHSGATREYDRLAALLAPISRPIYPVAGNHDDRERLLAALPLPGGSPGFDGGLQYTRRVGDRRLIVCDTKAREGHGGELGPQRLAWLSAQLAAGDGDGVIVAMHHPPLVTGVAVVDGIALREQDRLQLERALVARPGTHVIAGHLHRTMAYPFAAGTVWVCASVLPWDGTQIAAAWLAGPRERPGFTVHVWAPGAAIVSHAHAI
jgi:3',5'-cyclic AMP phosphodiesterase CpdA